MIEDELIGWYYRLDELEQALGVGDGQGSLACCSPWGCKELDTTLCDPIDSSPPGSSACGISQARILEWVAISFSRGSSQPISLDKKAFIDL